ncbi:zeta toxin family protein [Streptomyces sp. NPDC059567]|uniref:zeta toxin family protein n=1 Tax=Streptomyces sp. NPDC059567 TaxID=3346867 RepID=UPI0036BC0F17
MSVGDLYPKPLSARDNALLFNELIRPSLTGEPRENPVVLFVGGQPGAGKSSVQSAVLERLGRTTAFPLDGDELLARHPRHEEWSRDNDLTAAFLTGEDLKGRWWTRSARLLRAQRLDVVVSAPLAGPGWALERFGEFRRAGYQVGVVFVATHEAMSLQGIINRYHQARQPDQIGYGRWVPPKIHDQGYSGVLNTADGIDRKHAVDMVYVARRTGEIVHMNELTTEGWGFGVATRQTMVAERQRAWSTAESARFLQTQGRLRAELSGEWAPLLNSIEQRAVPVINPLTVHDDTQLAARKSDTIRLIEQAKQELDSAKARVDALKGAHTTGANAARLDELREAGTPPGELRRVRDAMHHDRWIAAVAVWGAPQQRLDDAQHLLDAIANEQQRRTALDPKQQHAEQLARQHLQALTVTQANPPAARRDGPRVGGPQQAGPGLGL